MSDLRVVLAEDDVLLREGLASLLERSGFQVVGQAGDAAGLLGRAGLLPSRLLRLLLGLTSAGGERDGRERDSEDEYSREPHLLSFPFLLD